MRTTTAMLVGLSVLGVSGSGLETAWAASDSTPNILFVIMDDVGIDQMRVFGYGSVSSPSTPTIDRIARSGVRFRNTWSMPACTTSRAVVFDARFPFRTNVLGALGPDDLANSMVSPFEMTTPKLLAQQGYESAMFGKFHLALQGKDPAGDAMPHNLGWDYFAGWLDETGDPSSIDLTAGGVATDGKTYSCGFVPGSRAGGADGGACYMADGSCRNLRGVGSVPPGRLCLDAGGILDPDKRCETSPPEYLDFTRLNGHYVSPLVYNYPDGSVERVPPTDARARRFRATLAVDEAIEWINTRPEGQPWMATVSFASVHTPIMQPPVDRSLLANVRSSDMDCSDTLVQRVLSKLMLESLDAELGRLLLSAHLASIGPSGNLVYRPERTDTMLIVLGDNGSLGYTVRRPFDTSRAKGTAYQTGVWVPLIVAGPLVERPSRIVSSMVNIADLYALFGEIAGIDDVRKAVPRPIDSEPMLPYLIDPGQDGIRQWNFTQVGTNLQANGAINGPCTISSTCTQIPVTKGVCEDNNGTWWGTGLDAPDTEGAPSEGFSYCCEVDAFLVARGEEPYDISPLSAVGIRNDRYKIVRNSLKAYVSLDQPCVDTTTTEFYAIDEEIPKPQLDEAGTELPLDQLTADQQQNFDALSAQLETLLASQKACPGDGNLDLIVDQKDLDDWRHYSESSGLSSVYDFNLDGLTDAADEAIIKQNLGLQCPND
ncbi:sulfatase-like hydrolase/transferase [Thiorhodococcus fuscus]|uniref:Sulfatase-like hydrolase/transferase n=1 Tax=Thiorhodococcus fuscus TaxID=527200 RepID=A0ABW4Y7Q8_9GAMM